MAVQPLDNRIIVRPVPSETMRASGLVLVIDEEEKPMAGSVLSIGPGRLNKAGERDPMQVKVGDRIMFGKYAQQPFEYGGESLLAMCEMDVLFVIED